MKSPLMFPLILVLSIVSLSAWCGAASAQATSEVPGGVAPSCIAPLISPAPVTIGEIRFDFLPVGFRFPFVVASPARPVASWGPGPSSVPLAAARRTSSDAVVRPRSRTGRVASR